MRTVRGRRQQRLSDLSGMRASQRGISEGLNRRSFNSHLVHGAGMAANDCPRFLFHQDTPTFNHYS